MLFVLEAPAAHIEISACREQVYLISLFAYVREKVLIAHTCAGMRRRALSTRLFPRTLDDLEDGLGFGLGLLVGVVDRGRIQLLKLLKFDESALEPVPLFCEVPPTFVADEFLTLPSLLFLPVLLDLVASLLSCQGPIIQAVHVLI